VSTPAPEMRRKRKEEARMRQVLIPHLKKSEGDPGT
jgi:hypothetical protein